MAMPHADTISIYFRAFLLFGAPPCVRFLDAEQRRFWPAVLLLDAEDRRCRHTARRGARCGRRSKFPRHHLGRPRNTKPPVTFRLAASAPGRRPADDVDIDHQLVAIASFRRFWLQTRNIGVRYHFR